MTDIPEEGGSKRHSGSFKPGFDPRRAIGPTRYKTDAGIQLAKIARDYSATAFAKLTEIIEDPKTSKRDLISAINLVFNRGFGTAQQIIKIEGTIAHEHLSVDLTKLPPDALRQLLAARLDHADPDAPPTLYIDADVKPVERSDDD